MIRTKSPKPPRAPANDSQMPGGSPSGPSLAQAKAPGGNGFLINHNAFTDARPPAAKGMKKSEGYPSFDKRP